MSRSTLAHKPERIKCNKCHLYTTAKVPDKWYACAYNKCNGGEHTHTHRQDNVSHTCNTCRRASAHHIMNIYDVNGNPPPTVFACGGLDWLKNSG